MRRRHLAFLAAAALACSARAHELVTLPTREGVTQSFYIPSMDAAKVEAIALLFAGGGGFIKLRMQDGDIRFGDRNFLPRSRQEFIRNGVLPVILDSPSDQQSDEGMSNEFRASAAHATDVRAVVAEVKKRYPGRPVFLVATSRGTLSVGHLAAALQGQIAGAVLTSSFFYESGGRRARPVLASYDWSALKVPLLFVHHRDDGCGATPYQSAAQLAGRFPLVSVRGGKPAESAACEPLAPHGFYGKEAPTIDAIAAWMLKRPFRKEID